MTCQILNLLIYFSFLKFRNLDLKPRKPIICNLGCPSPKLHGFGAFGMIDWQFCFVCTSCYMLEMWIGCGGWWFV